MGKEDVRRALEQILADDAVADRVAGGDFTGLDLDLTDEEKLIVQDAAADVPDVAGFAYEFYSKIELKAGLIGDKFLKGGFADSNKLTDKWRTAVTYLG